MITTHVLDISVGRPAQGVPVELERAAGSGWTALGSGVTDADGRQRELMPAGPVEPGTYRIRFSTADYFTARNVAGFYPVVEIQFTIEDGAQHYHVPLLLSAFGYSTYRGS